MIKPSEAKGVLAQNNDLSRNGFDYFERWIADPGPVPRTTEQRRVWRDHFETFDGIAELNTAIEYIQANGIPRRWTS